MSRRILQDIEHDHRLHRRVGVSVTNWGRFGALISALVLAGACDPSIDSVAAPVIAAPGQPSAARAISGVESDQVMGRLSPVALTIAAGLRDPTLRRATWVTLKDKKVNPVGLDLQRCGRASVAANLMAKGVQHVGGNAASFCRLIGEFKGMVLYMDRDRLQAWDGVSPIIVTAIEDLNAERPAHFAGYRVSGEVVSLPSDGSIAEPVLVVLPMSNRAAQRGPPPSGRAIQVPARQP